MDIIGLTFNSVKHSFALHSGFLLELGIIILLSTIIGLIAASLRQPMIPVYILVGLLLNYLSSQNIVFNKESILSMSELGIAFLLFLIGMEFDIGKIKDVLGFALVGTLIQVSLTTITFAFILKMFHYSFLESLIVALALSFSSTAIVVKYLSDKGVIDTIYGRNALSMLLMQDLFVVLISPFLIPSSSLPLTYHILDVLLKGSGLIALSIGINRLISKPLMKRFYSNIEIMFLYSLSMLFIFSIISSLFGFSIAIGGFIGGLASAVYPYSYRVIQRIAHLRDFFLVLFFVSLGLEMSLKSFNMHLLILGSFLILATILIKPFFYMLPSFLFGNDSKNSVHLGLILSQSSEFSLILAGIAYNVGLLSSYLVSLIGLVFFLSSFISSYLIQWSYSLSSHIYKYFEIFEKISMVKDKDNDVADSEKKHHKRNHIIIYGINAFTKVLLEKINREDITIISDDIYQVKVLKREGYDVVFGSIDDEELLRSIDISKAWIFIYAKENFEELSESLATVKSLNKYIKVIGRANNFYDALKLYNGGADFILIDGKHNYEDLKKVVEAILNHDNESLISLKEREINYISREIEKETLALNLPKELQEIKNRVMK